MPEDRLERLIVEEDLSTRHPGDRNSDRQLLNQGA
jgi:hypothetical protein